MKDKKMIVILLMSTCFILSMIFLNQDVQKSFIKDNLRFKKEYESLNHKKSEDRSYLNITIDKENTVMYASFDEIVDILNGKTGIIYFGFPECPWCRNVVPELTKVAKEEKTLIYYYNAYDDRDILEVNENGEVVTKKKGTKNYQKLLELLDEYLDEYILNFGENEVSTGEKRLYFPTVLFVSDGNIEKMHVSTVESQTDPSKPLDEKQKMELQNIYKDGLEKIKVTCQKDKC